MRRDRSKRPKAFCPLPLTALAVAVAWVVGAGLTLLFYIALHCMKTKPSALDFPKEFEPVGEAFAYPYDMLTGDVAKIIKDVKGMEKFAKEAAECKDPADKWEEQVGDFSKRMSAKVVVLEKLITRLGKMSEAMCVQFAEKPSDKAADDFFTKLSKFSGMFQAGVDFLNEEEAKRKKELDKKKKAAVSPAALALPPTRHGDVASELRLWLLWLQEKERKKKEKKAAAAKKKADKEKKVRTRPLAGCSSTRQCHAEPCLTGRVGWPGQGQEGGQRRRRRQGQEEGEDSEGAEEEGQGRQRWG